MEAEASPLHIVAFPWLAFGHIIPFLELSKRLAERGHAVTFVSTQRNVSRLPPVPSRLSPLITLVSLPLSRVEGLPEGAESTADIPVEKMDLLKKACDGLAAPFATFLAAACADEERAGEAEKRKKPDWILLDFCHHWLPALAAEHKVPCAQFLIHPAAFIAFVGPQWANDEHPRTSVEHFMAPPKWTPHLPTLAFRRHEAKFFAAAVRRNASGVSDVHRHCRTEQHCRLLIYRSCPDAEPQLSPLLPGLYRKPVVPAGLLTPSLLTGEGDTRGADAIRWLDEQPPGSVIYVALGSEAPLTAELARELALGLELSGARFLWALRKPRGMFDDAGAGGMLPEGFEARTGGRGVVAVGWVPQMRVLAHASVGAFLTHCGWGSTIESFQFGLPLVMLPFVVDQGLVARAMAEKRIGVEVARDEEDGSFSKDGVARAVRLVMVEGEGKVLARNAKKLQEVLGDTGRHEKYLDELVECLKTHK